MNELLVVVLVAGMVAIVSLLFRRRGYSYNQRIVLSGVAGLLLLWTGKSNIIQNPGIVVFYICGIAVLVYGARHLRKSQ